MNGVIVKTHFRQRSDDFPIIARVHGWRDSPSGLLGPPFCVDVSGGLLCVRCAGQDDVSNVCAVVAMVT